MRNEFKNEFNLKVGDIITFTNKLGVLQTIEVKRVEQKSWYAPGRNSYGTLKRYSKYPDFKITSKT